jgi:hypothetical protein
MNKLLITAFPKRRYRITTVWCVIYHGGSLKSRMGKENYWLTYALKVPYDNVM